MIFLPIKPEYAFAIHHKKKRVEFRKVKIKRSKERYCIVYASSPVKKVIGYFEIEKIEEGSPESMWTEYADCGGITLEAFNDYYDGNSKAVVFKIKEYTPLEEPIDPREKIDSFSIPQSFCYLDKEEVKKIFSGPNEGKMPGDYGKEVFQMQLEGCCV